MNGTYYGNSPKKKCKELRMQALDSLRGKWVIAILAMVIATILGAQLGTTGSGGGSGINLNMDLSSFSDTDMEDSVGIIGGEDIWGGDYPMPSEEDIEIFLQDILDNLPAIGAIASVFIFGVLIGLVASLAYTVFLGTPMRIGHLRFRLSLIDGEKADLAKIFSGFDRSYIPAILLRLLRALYLFLWSLPSAIMTTIGIVALIFGFVGSAFEMGGMEFVAPTLLLIGGVALLFGVGFSFLPTIAYYRYAMSDYILAENSEMSPSDALAESKRMMHGNKWRLFCLELSFIGWGILCLCTCGIGFLWLSPYMFQAEAAMYHEISGREAIHGAIADMKELMEQL
jgi:uncharacterized membrane protein